MISEIFLPMFYMMLLTLIVFSLSLTLRLKEIYLDKKEVDSIDGEAMLVCLHVCIHIETY